MSSPRFSAEWTSSGASSPFSSCTVSSSIRTIHVEADGVDVAVLLAAQQVAGAAQFQIERGDLEAGAQVGKFAQGRQTLAGDLAQFGVGGDQQIGVGAAVRAAHAAAQLVQLGEAVALGVFDDDGVGQRNVEAVFDDGGGDEHVVFVAHEAQQHALQFRPRPSARGPRRCGRCGTSSWIAGGAREDGIDAVVDEVDLAAAAQLLLDGGADQVRIEMRDHGVDRQAILGRRLDHAHVADAQQRHVQRARNGRGAHGEHVHVLPHLLQPLLVARRRSAALRRRSAGPDRGTPRPSRAGDACRWRCRPCRPPALRSTAFSSFAGAKRENISMRTGKAAKRRLNVSNAGTRARWWARARPPACRRPAP